MLDNAQLQRTGGWRQRSLGDLIARVEAGVSVNSEDRVVQDGEIGVLKTSCVSTGLFAPEEHKAVLEGERERVKAPVRSGCIIMSRMNTPALVGANAYVPHDYDWLFLPDRLWQLYPADDVNARWLSLVTSHPAFRAMISSVATGTSSSMKNVSQEAVLQLPVTVPPLEEQLRIATILSTWDETLDRLSRQIERKETVFTTLRGSLTNGQRRLQGWRATWKPRPLSAFLQSVKRSVPKPNKPYQALSLRSHGRGTFQRFVDRPETVDMDTLYRVGGRDLVVNITFAWEGAVALAKPEDEGCLVSHRFPTFVIDEDAVDRDFLGYVLNSRRFFYELGVVSPGGAGRNRVLNQRDFLEIEISLPPLDEQHAVAKVLLDIEREIAALEAERAALARQRDALATELLTGRLRVPQAEAAS